MRADDAALPVTTRTDRLLLDAPAPLPDARGPVSAALLRLLTADPGRSVDLRSLAWSGGPGTASLDEDLQLALWLAYEQHYRGLAGVHDDWEWQPELLWARREWEHHLLADLRERVAEPLVAGPRGTGPAGDPAAVVTGALVGLANADSEPSLSRHLMRDASAEQFAEFLTHRSLYHLKEADPHSWAIPRLSGSVKGALVTIQSDEYGLGVTRAMHAQLFRTLMRSWDLDPRYAGYLGSVPAVTLLATNLISLFGLHRRWRGALVGHLALFEMTSSTPNARYARGHRRLGGDEAAALFFDEHVVADAVHEQIALHDLAAGLVAGEPALAPDVVFGARCAAYADTVFAEHVLGCWAEGRSSLREAPVPVGVGR